MPPLAETLLTLVIAQTWSGEPVADDERVELSLRILPSAVEIRVDAPYHGDPPPPGPAGSFDGLWDFEVVELFVAGPASPERGVPYTEIELSPHGHFLVLRFEGNRHDVERGLVIDFEAAIDGDRWTGTARVPRTLLPPRPWTANAYAIHGSGSGRRHLAMIPVPGTTPDFHRPEVFQPL